MTQLIYFIIAIDPPLQISSECLHVGMCVASFLNHATSILAKLVKDGLAALGVLEVLVQRNKNHGYSSIGQDTGRATSAASGSSGGMLMTPCATRSPARAAAGRWTSITAATRSSCTSSSLASHYTILLDFILNEPGLPNTVDT